MAALCSKENSKSIREIRYIAILVIGVVLFSAVGVWILTYKPPSDWENVIPTISGAKSTNITTDTFNITGEKWQIGWWPSSSLDKCGIEIYNASTDMKLQQFTISTTGAEVNTDSGDIEETGSFYLEIQVNVGQEYGSWIIRVREYKPQPPFHVWIVWIIVMGIATMLVYLGYESYKVFRE